MKRVIVIVSTALITAASLTVAVKATGVSATSKRGVEPFKKATLIVETNSTDGDAGLQVSIDHAPWKTFSITRPDGQRIVDVRNRGVLKDYGLTELFSESSEPPFEQFPFAEFQTLFPEGDYRFTGQTIDGARMESLVTLTHNIPAGPEITSPSEDATVFADGLVVEWLPVTKPAGITIKAYQVLVVREEPTRVLDATLPADSTSLTIPTEFLQPGAYKVEVLAIEAGGNQTLTEVAFTVE